MPWGGTATHRWHPHRGFREQAIRKDTVAGPMMSGTGAASTGSSPRHAVVPLGDDAVDDEERNAALFSTAEMRSPIQVVRSGATHRHIPAGHSPLCDTFLTSSPQCARAVENRVDNSSTRQHTFHRKGRDDSPDMSVVRTSFRCPSRSRARLSADRRGDGCGLSHADG